jgi:HAD superfamily hydrolase (TIGR01490 family)
VKKEIAFFDFDGTITRSDTLLEFIRFVHGTGAFWRGFLRNSHFLVGYRLKLIDNQVAKEKILEHFFRGMTLDTFQEKCSRFAREVLPGLVRHAALDEINRLRKAGVIVVVVSASPENWISDWAKEHSVELIASQLEVKEGRLTGRIKGRNCHGEEKVKRIMEKHAIKDYDTVYAYGDSPGDRAMMGLASTAYYRPFRKQGRK